MKLRPVTRVGVAVATVTVVLLASPRPRSPTSSARSAPTSSPSAGSTSPPTRVPRTASRSSCTTPTAHPIDDLGTPVTLKVQVIYGTHVSPLPRPRAVVGSRHRSGHPRRVGCRHHADAARQLHVPLHRHGPRPDDRPEVHVLRRDLQPGPGSDHDRVPDARHPAPHSRPRPSRSCRSPPLPPRQMRARPRTPRPRPRRWRSSASSSPWCSAAWPSASPCRGGRVGPRPDALRSRDSSGAHRAAGRPAAGVRRGDRCGRRADTGDRGRASRRARAASRVVARRGRRAPDAADGGDRHLRRASRSEAVAPACPRLVRSRRDQRADRDGPRSAPRCCRSTSRTWAAASTRWRGPRCRRSTGTWPAARSRSESGWHRPARPRRRERRAARRRRRPRWSVAGCSTSGSCCSSGLPRSA